MKRLMICGVALMLAAALVACGSQKEEETLPVETTAVETTVATEDKLTIVVTIPETTEETTPPETIAPTQEITLPEVTAPTVPEETVPSWEAPTAPLVTAPMPELAICDHLLQSAGGAEPGCEEAGYQNYLCSKCGVLEQKLLLPLGHHFWEADCLIGQVCERCGITQGAPLGHLYIDGSCSRCGEPDPSVRHITITVKDNKNTPVPGVTVELYTTGDQPAGTCVSDTEGKLYFTLRDHPGKYTLVLTQVPQGYTVRQDRYEYGSDSGAIVLELVPVIHPEDHSRADYKTGATMGDFTLTDVDGNVYTLSQLLETKRLVMLNFWYCNCVPCKAEFPYFNTVYQRYGSDIEILALNHMDGEDQIRKLRDEMGLEFPLIREQLGMKEGFNIRSYPVTVFIGQNGRILHIQKDVPFESEEALDKLIRQLLGI